MECGGKFRSQRCAPVRMPTPDIVRLSMSRQLLDAKLPNRLEECEARLSVRQLLFVDRAHQTLINQRLNHLNHRHRRGSEYCRPAVPCSESPRLVHCFCGVEGEAASKDG